MNSIYNLKIFIQSNPNQELAAKVSAYSFSKYGFNNITIMKLKENQVLNKYFYSEFFRGGSKKIYDPNDLQSFTFLRFYHPEICNEFCLIIDPDVFAVKDPADEISKYIKENGKFKIFCTKKNDKIRSEVSLVNCKNFNLWDFNKLTHDIFNYSMDYNTVINYNFVNQESIGIMSNQLNEFDEINENTILLHTTNRITQPWKESLPVDFKINTSKKNYLKNFIKKTFGLNYNKNLFYKNYIKHKNENVINFVGNLFSEAYNSNFIDLSEIKVSIKNSYLSKRFIVKHISNLDF